MNENTEAEDVTSPAGESDIRADLAAVVAEAKAAAPVSEPEYLKESAPVEKTEAPKTETAPVENKTAEPVKEEPKEIPEVPRSWSTKDLQVFSALPADAQKVIVAREKQLLADYTRKTMEVAEIKKQAAAEKDEASEVLRAFKPHAEKFALMGASPGQAISQLIAAQNFLDKDPVAGLQWMAQKYGLSLQDVMQGPQRIDPERHAIKQELEEIKSWKQQLLSQQEEQASAALRSEVENFARATDTNGQLLYPYFSHLETSIAPIAKALREQYPTAPNAAILKEAYDRACYAEPQVRQHILQTQQAAQEAKRKQEMEAATNKAKNAAVSINGSPNGSSNAPIPDSVRSTILQTIREQRA